MQIKYYGRTCLRLKVFYYFIWSINIIVRLSFQMCNIVLYYFFVAVCSLKRFFYSFLYHTNLLSHSTYSTSFKTYHTTWYTPFIFNLSWSYFDWGIYLIYIHVETMFFTVFKICILCSLIFLLCCFYTVLVQRLISLYFFRPHWCAQLIFAETSYFHVTVCKCPP